MALKSAIYARDGGGAPEITIYGPGQAGAVALLVVAGVLSIAAILCSAIYYLFFTTRRKTYHRTNLAPYLVSLLLANVLQAIGTIMNARWAKDGIVFYGKYCEFQGALKNAANVGTAIWSFAIAVHVFNLLFLRWRTTRLSMIATLVGGWCFVLMIVTLGPFAIATPEQGPYFGVSGNWCWITDNYPKEQTFMEYFFEFLSSGLGFALYMLVLLRVRGNLVKRVEEDEEENEKQRGRKQWALGNKWRFVWIPRSEAWQLCFGRDMLDSAMLRVAANMVWYPVAYSVILVPIALARFSTFTGHNVPFWATIFTDTIFNLTGLVNATLLIYTRSVLPDTASLPSFVTPRPRPQSTSSSIFSFVTSQYSHDRESKGDHHDKHSTDFSGQLAGVSELGYGEAPAKKSSSAMRFGGVTPYVLPPLEKAQSPSQTGTRAVTPPAAQVSSPASPAVEKEKCLKPSKSMAAPGPSSSSLRPFTLNVKRSRSADVPPNVNPTIAIPMPTLPRLLPSPPINFNMDEITRSLSDEPLNIHNLKKGSVDSQLTLI